MKAIIKNSIILCVITLVSGVLLGMVYEVTKEPRAKQEELAKQEAYQKVFQEAEEFVSLEYNKDELGIYLKDNKIPSNIAYIEEVVTAMDSNGQQLGYVVTVTDKEGYGGNITFTLGVKNDGTILGLSFLTLEETAGVGMKVDTDSFKGQFEGKNVDAFVYVKGGKQADNEIDAIGGATVSTNAVVNGVNAGILCVDYLNSVQTGGNENE